VDAALTVQRKHEICQHGRLAKFASRGCKGTSLTILLRLLVAQITTSVSFCWFDEPLEHLDPEVRRVVANLLSQVTGENGPLRQVVVTTYEERLARLLHARDEHQVTLIDVRQASRHRSVHGG
jgi:DNA repair exonuclease SbcCD ATPase subunit